MNLSLRKLLKTFPEFNQRIYTQQDFWEICDLRTIEVIERNRQRKKGYYLTHSLGEFIFINSSLKNYVWLSVAFHELTHAILHFPSPFLANKQQFEADAFSTMMLCPLSELDAGSEMREAALYNHQLKFILRERERIYFLHQDFGLRLN